MLVFELIAPFLALLSVLVAVGLFVMERQARRDPAEQQRRPAVRRPLASGRQAAERVRRPSMLP